MTLVLGIEELNPIEKQGQMKMTRVYPWSHARLPKLFFLFFPDEKEKYDPSAFRDAIIQGLNETGADLEQVSSATEKRRLHG